MKIDAHHHFWKYSLSEYAWIDDTMASIRRDFLPGDLLAETREAGIDKVVSVQARQSLEETRWLLDLARDNELIAGVVGWVPLVNPDVEQTLQGLIADNPKLRGMRHVLQGEPEPGYMLRDDFNAGIRTLTRHDLAYDILILSHQLDEALKLVDKHPRQRFVLDHIAKPKIRAKELEPWRSRMRELARRPNVWCKISGVVTEADLDAWAPADIRPYLDVALGAFGAKRVMFGSDWPVCLVATDYNYWVEVMTEATSALTAGEQNAFWAENALAAYKLSNSTKLP